MKNFYRTNHPVCRSGSHPSFTKAGSFAKKLVVFAAALILVRLAFLPFYVNELEYRKQVFDDGEYTAVFIGTSRTKWAVIPAYFDQLAGNVSVSYNFGIDNALPPETFEWSEEFMDAKPSLKYIFIELSGSAKLVPSNEDRLLWRIARFAERSNLRDISERFDLFALRIFKPLVPKRDDKFVDRNAPYELPSDVRTPEVENNNTSETEIQKTFMRSSFLESHDPLAEELAFPVAYWGRITRFVEFAEARGVSVYFFVPPRIETEEEIKTILPIYRKLAIKNKLEKAHDDKSLYSVGTSVDNFHLNKDGALIFTRNLAEQFAKKNTGR